MTDRTDLGGKNTLENIQFDSCEHACHILCVSVIKPNNSLFFTNTIPGPTGTHNLSTFLLKTTGNCFDKLLSIYISYFLREVEISVLAMNV